MAIITQFDPTETTMNELGASSPSFSNPAVANCCKAWKRVFRAALAADDSFHAPERAGEAYRAAMPPLSSRENCLDFIACVAHGMLLGAIHEKNGTKLLYAAQVALTAAGAPPKSQPSLDPYANLTESERRRAKKFEDKPGRAQ